MVRPNDSFIFSVVVIILVFCFFAFDGAGDLSISSRRRFPDFNHYDRFTHTLSNREFPTDDKDRRIIVIGDVHGRNRSLTTLLNQISYDARKDTLIHLGDLVTKAPVKDSLAILSFMASNNVLGVRGNNDQDVIKWRSWMDWMMSQPGGREWLEEVDKHWSDYDGATDTPPGFHSWLKKSKRRKKFRGKIPKGWKPLGQHYRVARAMSREHYEYLRSLPLVLHAPAGHVFFVHAGLLAADPRRKLTHHKQPLSHWPPVNQSKHDIPALREAQEVALLSEVPQNRDPWVVQNMRSVRKKRKISRSNSKGTPFPNLWNGIMDRCSGSNMSDAEFASIPRLTGSRKSPVDLPCYPSTVVYGHAAVRGLDPRRWSIGLDSACCYGRRLSALVLDTRSFPATDAQLLHDPGLDFPHEVTHRSDVEQDYLLDFPPEETDQSSRRIRFGHAGEALVVSVSCR